MSQSYSVLNKLPPETFLDPTKFRTDWDAKNSNGERQYQSGLETGRAANTIHINASGTWSASMKDGSSLFSHEGIGYHAHTESLLRGFLDSGARVDVTRLTDDGFKTTIIKAAKPTGTPADA